MTPAIAETIVKSRRPLARCLFCRGIGVTHPYSIDDRVDGVYPPATTADGAWIAAANLIIHQETTR